MKGLIKPIERYGIKWPSMGLFWLEGEAGTEAVEATPTGPASTQMFSVDDIDLDVEAEKEGKSSDELEVEVEGSGEVSKEGRDEIAQLKQQIQELQADLLNLSKKPKAEVQPKVDTNKKEEKLTRAQLVQILKEHKDNPEVLLNVAEYIAEQKAEETRDATMKDVNQRQWHSNLSGMANRILSEDEDGYLAANPKVRDQLGDYATNLGFDNHPLGNLAAYAILRLKEFVSAKSASKVDEKLTKEEKLSKPKGQMDKTRLQPLRDKSSGLNAEQLAMAKKLGVKPETYAKFVVRS